MKIKKSLLMLSSICGAAVLVSCGGRGDNIGPVETDGFIKEKTQIVFKTTAGKGSQPVLERYIKSFKEIEPNVEVVLDIVQGSYADIAKNTISGFTTGDYGDLVMVYPDAVADFIDYGRAFNLDPYINSTEYGFSKEDLNDILPTFLDEGRKYVVDGTYSLPMAKSTEVVYYDQDRILNLEITGINNGNPIDEDYLNSLTWEEFFGNFCPKIMDYVQTEEGKALLNTSDTNHAVMSYDSDDNLFITLAEQNGFDYTGVENGKGKAKFNNDNMKQLMYKWNDYSKKHYITSAGASGKRSNELFQTNSVLFSVGSTAGASYQNKTEKVKVGVFKIPHAEGRDPKVILQGPSISILRHKNAENKWDENRQLASWLFYKHMVESENCLDWSLNANYMPIRKSLYSHPDYIESNKLQGLSPTSLDALKARINNYIGNLTDYYYTSPAFKGSNECRQQVGGIVSVALTPTKGQAEINEVFQSAYNQSVIAIG